MQPRTLILRAAGVNCEAETAHAFERAGATTDIVHVNQLMQLPRLLEGYQLLAIPGGFSYGDDISAGKILANQFMHHLRDNLHAFRDAGKPIIGICNGFQVLVKTDLLPDPVGDRPGQTATLTNNDSGRYHDRWIRLAVRSRKCVWTKNLGDFDAPMAHGEGKFVPADDATRRALWDEDRIALVYVKPDGSPAGGEWPHNPNGSADDIAGACDATGLVLGMMPHPERFISPLQHPAWTSWASLPEEAAGLAIFRNAVDHARDAVGAGV
ncbi:MAG TPA: phosphoribosylformylglycinamidine synthase I [Tepidisphaeraceae bacterium]|nr:phosphoribosylformylglycinamidine synthase I [Tepidisphaeraceae bacterium]